jgi:Ca2+-binding EF-hand superfamily protein
MKSIDNLFPNEQFTKSEMTRLMDRFDHNGDGMISREEFHEFLKLDDLMERERKNKRKSRKRRDTDDDEDDD